MVCGAWLHGLRFFCIFVRNFLCAQFFAFFAQFPCTFLCALSRALRSACFAMSRASRAMCFNGVCSVHCILRTLLCVVCTFAAFRALCFASRATNVAFSARSLAPLRARPLASRSAFRSPRSSFLPPLLPPFPPALFPSRGWCAASCLPSRSLFRSPVCSLFVSFFAPPRLFLGLFLAFLYRYVRSTPHFETPTITSTRRCRDGAAARPRALAPFPPPTHPPSPLLSLLSPLSLSLFLSLSLSFFLPFPSRCIRGIGFPPRPPGGLPSPGPVSFSSLFRTGSASAPRPRAARRESSREALCVPTQNRESASRLAGERAGARTRGRPGPRPFRADLPGVVPPLIIPRVARSPRFTPASPPLSPPLASVSTPFPRTPETPATRGEAPPFAPPLPFARRASEASLLASRPFRPLASRRRPARGTVEAARATRGDASRSAGTGVGGGARGDSPPVAGIHRRPSARIDAPRGAIAISVAPHRAWEGGGHASAPRAPRARARRVARARSRVFPEDPARPKRSPPARPGNVVLPFSPLALGLCERQSPSHATVRPSDRRRAVALARANPRALRSRPPGDLGADARRLAFRSQVPSVANLC